MKPCTNVRPPTGPELALAEAARHGVAAEQARDGAGVVIGLREHVAAAAVAREEERGRAGVRLLPGQQLVQLARGRLGVAHVQAHRLPDARDVADGQGARVGVRAEHAAHEEVAQTVLGTVLVDHEADQEAVLEQQPIRQRELLDDLPHALQRGAARQLEHEVALRGRDHQLGADRAGALRDDRGQRQALEHDADGALLGAAAVREQARGTVTSEAREAAQHGHAAEAVDELLHRRRVGIGERDHERSRGRRRQADELGPFMALAHLRVERRDARARREASPRAAPAPGRPAARGPRRSRRRPRRRR